MCIRDRLAKERGEEPPKPFSLLDASRAARERRQRERDARGQGPKHTGKGSTAWTPPQGGSRPTYGGPTPPPGWTYPGANNAPADVPERSEHPGMRNYAPKPEQPQEPKQQEKPEQPEQEQTEEIGFRLPENERPTDSYYRPSEDTTQQMPRHRKADEDTSNPEDTNNDQ